MQSKCKAVLTPPEKGLLSICRRLGQGDNINARGILYTLFEIQRRRGLAKGICPDMSRT